MIAHLQVVLTLLKAQAVLYQTAHWQAAGPQSYADHLLFGRLYEGLDEEIDALAEKMVAYGGPEAVDPQVLETMVLGAVQQATKTQNLIQRMLHLEQVLQNALEILSEDSEEIPVGLLDFLTGLASDHESHIYLLQQAERPSFGRTASSMAPTAEGYFFDSPKRREVREFSNSDALSNSKQVVQDAVKTYPTEDPPREEIKKVKEAPPTPKDILRREPATGAFSTLSRFLVETTQPLPRKDEKRVPDGWEDIPKQEGEPVG